MATGSVEIRGARNDATGDIDGLIKQGYSEEHSKTVTPGGRNENTAIAYDVSTPECEYYVLDEADGTAVAVSGAVPATLYSVYVNETLADGTIILEDGAGNAVITLPSGLAAGVVLQFEGMMFDTDLTANAAAGLSTGNITIGWRAQ